MVDARPPAILSAKMNVSKSALKNLTYYPLLQHSLIEFYVTSQATSILLVA